jgi:hypothetical protein
LSSTCALPTGISMGDFKIQMQSAVSRYFNCLCNVHEVTIA